MLRPGDLSQNKEGTGGWSKVNGAGGRVSEGVRPPLGLLFRVRWGVMCDIPYTGKGQLRLCVEKDGSFQPGTARCHKLGSRHSPELLPATGSAHPLAGCGRPPHPAPCLCSISWSNEASVYSLFLPPRHSLSLEDAGPASVYSRQASWIAPGQ